MHCQVYMHDMISTQQLQLRAMHAHPSKILLARLTNMELQYALHAPQHDQIGALFQLLVLEELSKFAQGPSVSCDAHARR